MSSASVPSAMIRPSCRTAIRSASCSASSRYCVVSRMVVPRPASSRIVCQTSSRDCGSSPVVGSSRKSTGGSPMRLIAMSRRRRMPPEYVAARRPPASVRPNRSSRASATAPASAHLRSCATRTRFSRPVRTSSTAANWPVRLIESPDLGRRGGDVVAVDAGAAAVRPEQGGQDAHHRRLAGAVGAEEGVDGCPRRRSGRRPAGLRCRRRTSSARRPRWLVVVSHDASVQP